MRRQVRLVPLLVLIAGLVVFFALGLQRYISFEVLRENREALLDWVARQGIAHVPEGRTHP